MKVMGNAPSHQTPAGVKLLNKIYRQELALVRERQLQTNHSYTMLDEGCDIPYLGYAYWVVNRHNRTVLDDQEIERPVVDCVTTIITGSGRSK